MQWETDCNIGASGLDVLLSDNTLHQAVIDFNSAEQDPWWLMDQVVVNDSQLQNILGENVGAPAKAMSDVAEIGVFSPFETQHLSDMAVTFSLLVVPDTFGSIAMKVKGAWSNSSVVKLKPEQCPKIGESGIYNNVTAPYWYDTVEHEQVEDKQEDMTAENAVHAQLHMKGTSQKEDARKRSRTSREQPALAVSRVYRSRRVRYLYDHAICESLSRGDVSHTLLSSLFPAVVIR